MNAKKTPGPMSTRVQNIKISATKEMPMIAAKRGGCVSLGQGVPSFAPPDHVLEAVAKSLRDDPGASKYSLQPGMPALREAVAEVLEREKGVSAEPGTEIAITVGAMEGLLAAMLSIVERGDEVIVPTPYYPSHVEQILLAEGRPVLAPLKPESWELDPETVKRAISDKSKAIIINTPHNPTGANWSEGALRAVADLALEHGLYIICDDTYDALTFDERPSFSLSSIPELRDQLVALGSFSKRYALTGWRVGYVYAREKLMDELLKVHDCTAICAPTPSQYAALAALQGPQAPFEEFRRILESRRELACSALDKTSPNIDYVRPGGAFYIMARYRHPAVSPREMAEKLIHEAGVVTIPGDSFGVGGEFSLRLSFGGAEEDLDEAFSRMSRWFASRLHY